MKDLYIDFDGVIKDTIKVSYKMMEDEKIDLRDRPKVIEFYKQLDWEYLLKISDEIKNAYYFINKISEEGTFNPKILTTVNSLNEIKAKLSDIKKNCKNITLVSVPSGIEKSVLVNPKNSILVDDYRGNLISWQNSGGIPVKFANEISSEFITINTLEVFTEKEICKNLCLRR